MSFMKQYLVRFSVGVALAAAFALPAAAQEDVKIGVVNLQYIVQNAPQTKAVMAALDEEFAPRQRELVAKQKEFEDLTARIQKDAAVMGESERQAADKEYRSLQRDLQRIGTELQEDAQLRQNEELGKLQRTLFQQVRDYAQAQGYDLVLTDGVLFASNAINITEGALASISSGQAAAAAQ